MMTLTIEKLKSDLIGASVWGGARWVQGILFSTYLNMGQKKKTMGNKARIGQLIRARVRTYSENTSFDLPHCHPLSENLWLILLICQQFSIYNQENLNILSNTRQQKEADYYINMYMIPKSTIHSTYKNSITAYPT